MIQILLLLYCYYEQLNCIAALNSYISKADFSQYILSTPCHVKHSFIIPDHLSLYTLFTPWFWESYDKHIYLIQISRKTYFSTSLSKSAFMKALSVRVCFKNKYYLLQTWFSKYYPYPNVRIIFYFLTLCKILGEGGHWAMPQNNTSWGACPPFLRRPWDLYLLSC